MRQPSVKTLQKLGITKLQAKVIKSGLADQQPDDVMRVANEYMGGHGVENIYENSSYWPILCYVNVGETYQITLCHDVVRDAYYVCSWGDWVETAERNRRYQFA